jgi:hypothetical protein
MQELKGWNSFIYLPNRHTFDRMSMLPERLPDPLKQLPLSGIFQIPPDLVVRFQTVDIVEVI